MKQLKLVMVIGAPASGKSTTSKFYADQSDFVYLNRDTLGKSIADLVPLTQQAFVNEKNVILDNLFPTVESRKPFIEIAEKFGAEIRCKWVTTSIEDSTINALHRMWDRYGKLFMTPESLKEVKDDHNMFPICVLFKYKKEFQEPNRVEGFHFIDEVKFTRKIDCSKNNKAVIFDYDQTLRDVKNKGNFAYPICPEDVMILPNRKEVIADYWHRGYKLLGASNQSGVSKNILSHDDAEHCFYETNQQLGFDIDYMFCPHSVPPTCYCRKPQSGIGVYLIEKHKLRPSECIFVGDQTTDKTFAKRLGFQYVDQSEFFK